MADAEQLSHYGRMKEDRERIRLRDETTCQNQPGRLTEEHVPAWGDHVFYVLCPASLEPHRRGGQPTPAAWRENAKPEPHEASICVQQMKTRLPAWDRHSRLVWTPWDCIALPGSMPPQI